MPELSVNYEAFGLDTLPPAIREQWDEQVVTVLAALRSGNHKVSGGKVSGSVELTVHLDYLPDNDQVHFAATVKPKTPALKVHHVPVIERDGVLFIEEEPDNPQLKFPIGGAR